VENTTREQLVTRLAALSEDAVDFMERQHPDGFNVGVIGMVFEVLVQHEGSPHLRRSDGGYTPDDGIESGFHTWCSDTRWWVKDKLFEMASAAVIDESDAEDEDEDERHDENEDEG
jgi:hypothetical protein